MKKQGGITLIALVVTIVVLIILSITTINLLIGNNGIITTATRAKEEMTISEGKEKIELALLDMYTERSSNGNNCDLDYIGENIGKKVKDIKIEGKKGSPVIKIYLSYKDYMYKIIPNLEVKYVGNVNIEEEPEIEIIRDTTETGVEKVNLNIKATVQKGEISEIVKPDGNIEYSEETTYEVTSNGNYTFKAVTEKGIIEEKTIEIQSINEKDAIEITSGSTGETIKCNHIYEKKYNNESHWKQCIFCNNKINETKHTLVTIGEEGCSQNLGKQTQYCTDSCGYKITLPKQSHGTTSILAPTWANVHRTVCNICNGYINEDVCKNEKGERLGCKTGISGTCSVCGAQRNTNHMELLDGKCRECGKKLCEYERTKEVLNQNQIKVKFKYIPLTKELVLEKNKDNIGVAWTKNVEITNNTFTKNDDGSIELEGIINVSSSTPTVMMQVRGVFNYSYNGYSNSGYTSFNLYPDSYAPKCISITSTGASSNEEFSRSVTITAKFEETWDSIVEMALYDSDGTVISDWSVASKDGTTFTKTFNVIAETKTSKELTVKAKDRCGNIAEEKVTIGKIDTKAPTLISNTEYNKQWGITKLIRLEATDEGAGGIQIALGNEEDYKEGKIEENKTYREYKVTGDVYEDIIRIAYLKDAVGNVATKRLTIGKIDRTSPTITNINVNGKNIKIEANDMNTKLNKEGSGIKGYAISKTREVPADNVFQANNTFTADETGTYYIWAKDNAGNLSQTKQIEIK